MMWLLLAGWAVVIAAALTLLWLRAARAGGNERPGPVLAAVVPLVVLGAGALYGVLGLHPDTAHWLDAWHRYRAPVQSLLTSRPDPAAQDVPLVDVTRVMQRIATREDAAEAWYAVAMLYDELGGAPQSVQAARRAVELEPGEFGPRLLLARSLITEADGRLVPEARALLDELVAEEPEHDGAWMMIAMAAMRSGDYALAVTALDSLLSRHTEEEAAVPLRRARERAQAMQESRAWLTGLTVRVEAPETVPPGGTLFVFLRRAGDEGGQPLAATRVLADGFPVQVTLEHDHWLQAPPARGTALVAGARYAPAPGSAVDQTSLEAAPRALEQRDGVLRATLALR